MCQRVICLTCQKTTREGAGGVVSRCSRKCQRLSFVGVSTPQRRTCELVGQTRAQSRSPERRRRMKGGPRTAATARIRTGAGPAGREIATHTGSRALSSRTPRQLSKYGIRYPDELLQRSQVIDRAKELVVSLQVPLATVEWMRDVCLFIQKCPNERHAPAWTDLLIQEGVDTPDSFAELLRE